MTREEYFHRLLATIGLLLLLLFLWQSAQIVFLVFAGLLLAIFLGTLAGWLYRHSPLAYGACLAAVGLFILLTLAGLGWLLAPSVGVQFSELQERFPDAVAQAWERIGHYRWGQIVKEQTAGLTRFMPQGAEILKQVTGFFTITIGVVAGLVIILFIGIFFAAAPQRYFEGILYLVPINRRPRIREVFEEVGKTLQAWLLGQLCSMCAIGLLTGLGLWMLGMPLPLALGFLAGFLEFIPSFGPILSAVPAVLLAFVTGPRQALYVVGLYVIIQFVESHLLMPLVQQRAVELPPVLTLVALLLLGSMFGFLGLLLATPIAAVVMVLMKRLYVEDALGDHLNNNKHK